MTNDNNLFNLWFPYCVLNTVTEKSFYYLTNSAYIFFLRITNCVTNTNTIKAIKETMWQRSSTIFLWRPKIGQYHIETTVFLCERETQWKDSFNTISKTGNLGLVGCTVECAVMQEGRSERCGGAHIVVVTLERRCAGAWTDTAAAAENHSKTTTKHLQFK